MRHDEGDREARVPPVLRHLDRDHPDTVRLLARFATGGRDVAAASFSHIDAEKVYLHVRDPSGNRIAELQFSGPVEHPGQLRQELRALLIAARQALPAAPLTSLELQMREGRSPGEAPGTAAREG